MEVAAGRRRTRWPGAEVYNEVLASRPPGTEISPPSRTRLAISTASPGEPISHFATLSRSVSVTLSFDAFVRRATPVQAGTKEKHLEKTEPKIQKHLCSVANIVIPYDYLTPLQAAIGVGVVQKGIWPTISKDTNPKLAELL
ncbi:hypothetical protein ZWY2020_059745 [Hordeum vulgare]|nr:hypothetical protein ZWY2020_059745 [Hordeum vulgare]